MSGRTADQIGHTDAGARQIPPLAPAVVGPIPDTVDVTLPSGLRVFAVHKPGAPLVEVRLRIPLGRPAGSRTAPQVHAARAELLAAGLLLGTDTLGRVDVDTALADVGGHLDASVDAQRLMVSGSALATGLNTMLNILGQTMTGAAYRRDDVQIERDRLHEHLLIAAQQPAAVARQYLLHRRFGDHPAAWETPLGSDIAVVTPVQLRTLHQRQVVPRGSVLVVVGAIDPAQAVAAAADSLGGWTADRDAVPLAAPPALQPGPLAGYDHPGAVQSQVRLSAPALGRSDPGYPAQQLANLIYGGYFSSRLVENIREDKGYTYSAGSAVSFWPGRAGLTVSFDTATASTAPAIWEAQYELGRLALNPPTGAEVDAARNYALGTLATALATQAGYAGMMSSLLGSGLDQAWLSGYQEQIAALTVEDVHGVARTGFAPSAFNGIVVGDRAEIGAAIAAITAVEWP